MRDSFVASGRWRLPLGAVLAAVLLAGGTDASAAEVPVEFVSNAPLTYDLATLRQAGELEVKLHNGSDSSVRVKVRVVEIEPPGKPDPALAALFPREGETKEISPGEEGAVTIPLAGAKDPAAGSYTGALVVTPERGALSRRPLTITVAGAAPAAEGAVLDAVRLPDVTLRAINFLPSPLAPAGPTALALAVLAALVLGLWWRWIGRRAHGSAWRMGVGALVVLLVLSAILLDVFEDQARQPGLQAITAESLPVSEATVNGRVGVALDGRGDVAELRVDDKRLSAKGLRHAGSYAGHLDLNGAADEGSAKAAVNVQDWWPWAAVAIALGVLLAYLTRRWFESDRPRTLLRLEGARVWHELTKAAAAADARPNWVPRRRVRTRLAAFELQLDSPAEATAAREQLDAIHAYVEDSRALRNRISEHEAVAATYHAQWVAENFGVPEGEVRALVRLQELLRRPFDDDEPDTSRSQLEAAEAEVEATGALLREGRELHALIAGHAASAERVGVMSGDPVVENEMRSTKTKLRAFGARVLRAASSEEVRELRKQVRDELAPLPEAATEVVSAGEMSVDELPSLELLDGGGLGLRESPLEPTAIGLHATIEMRVMAALTGSVTSGYTEDTFEVRAVIDGALPGLPVQWSINGQPELRWELVPPNGCTPWFEHRFPTAGEHRVALFDREGNELASRMVTVKSTGRLEGEQMLFAERDRRWVLVAGAATILSGMLSLYFSDAGWGTNDDYLKALLWGGAVAEGIALVGTLLGRVFPTSK